MATLIFGGGGFVGLNIAEHMLERGQTTIVFDLSSPPEMAVDRLTSLPGELRVVTGDVTNLESVEHAFGHDIEDVVFGAAITAGPDRDAYEPERILDVNLTGFLNVLRAARGAGVRRIVNLSSAGAYGMAAMGDEPLDEARTCVDPVSIYSLTKFGTERIGARLADLWELDVRSVRLSAVFGRWERVTSVRDTPSPQFQVMELALSGKPALFSRAGLRDWVYGTDVAAAVGALLEAETLDHDLYNISGGVSYTALDWAKTLVQHLPGFEARLCLSDDVTNIDLHSPADRQPLRIDRLLTDTGFRPAFGLDESVVDYLRWAQHS